MKVFVLAALLAVVGAQNCRPTTNYVLRHTRRLDAGVDTRTLIDAVLMNEGRTNAISLRDEFLKGIALGHIFVTQTTYSYQVAMPLGLATGIPVTAYEMGIINDTNPNPDLAMKIANLNPCPEDILIVTHGFQIEGVLRTVGYTGPEIFDIAQFQRIYILKLLPNDIDFLSVDFFGPPGSDNSNGPLPCGENVEERFTKDDDPTIIKEPKYNSTYGQCAPQTFHMIRHANRYSLGITTLSQEDAIMIQEGRERSLDLMEKMMTTHPVEHIMISQTTYSYQTAMPLAEATGLPMTVYFWGTNTDQSDLGMKLSNLDPCPESVLIVNHGAFLQAIMREVGYTGPNIDNIGLYGRFYTMHANAPQTIIPDTYGPPCVLCANQPLPADCSP